MDRPFTAYQGNEPYIFVSYAHEDADVVYLEIQWLKDQGFNIWYDEGISPGHEWHQQLADRIDGSSLFLYFITPESAASEHCQREVHYAIDNGKQLLAVHVEATDLPSGLKLSLSSIQAVLRHELPDLEYRVKLIKGVSSHIERGIGVAAAPTPNVSGFGKRTMGVAVIMTAAVTAVLTFLVAARWIVAPSPEASPRPARSFVLDHGEYRSEPYARFRISPVGDRLLYSTRGMIYALNTSDAMEAPVMGTEGALAEFRASPDGQWIAFFEPALGAERRPTRGSRAGSWLLKRVPINGGTAATIARISGQEGLAWGPNDTLVVGSADGLMQVSAMEGAPVQLTTPAPGEIHRLPFVLPAGRGVLFVIWDAVDRTSHVAVLSPDGDEPPKKLVLGTQPKFTPTGHLLFHREGAIWAAPFDADGLRLTSDPTPVIQDVADARYSLSSDGTLVYEVAATSTAYELMFINREGRETPVGAPHRDYQQVAVSPDGNRLAVVIGDAFSDADIWVYSRDQNNLMRHTFDAKGAFQPQWIDDGETIAYSRLEGGAAAVFARRANGTGDLEMRLSNSDYIYSLGPSQAALGACTAPDACDIAVPSDAEAGVTVILTGAQNDIYPDVSADGRYMTYGSDEAGRYEIYVRPFPNVDDGKWQVSNSGATTPYWTRSGQEIIYRDFTDTMMAVPVTRDPEFRAGTPRVLFDASGYRNGLVSATPAYDVMPDAEHVVMIKPVEGAEPKVVLVENFFDELERLAPHPD